jgi:hypothetical protein
VAAACVSWNDGEVEVEERDLNVALDWKRMLLMIRITVSTGFRYQGSRPCSSLVSPNTLSYAPFHLRVLTVNSLFNREE